MGGIYLKHVGFTTAHKGNCRDIYEMYFIRLFDWIAQGRNNVNAL